METDVLAPAVGGAGVGVLHVRLAGACSRRSRCSAVRKRRFDNRRRAAAGSALAVGAQGRWADSAHRRAAPSRFDRPNFGGGAAPHLGDAAAWNASKLERQCRAPPHADEHAGARAPRPSNRPPPWHARCHNRRRCTAPTRQHGRSRHADAHRIEAQCAAGAEADSRAEEHRVRWTASSEWRTAGRHHSGWGKPQRDH